MRNLKPDLLAWIWLSILPVLTTSQTPGQLALHVPCAGDTTEQYAIYLPEAYTETEQWPVLFVFDPAARAEHAARIFQGPAEDLGYIVIVSHSSRNGPWEPILKAADAIFEEAFAGYSIDTNRIYTTGFSGGSRAAMLLALGDTRIDGVIGCGAGMPISIELPKPLAEYEFVYVGCVGTQDMNYHEHIEHRGVLDDAGITNTLLIFRGPHQWPPEDILREAMLYQDMVATKRGVTTKSLPEMAYRTILQRARVLNGEGYLVLSSEVLGEIGEDYEGMLDVSDATALRDSIISTKAYKKQIQYAGKIARRESALQAEFDAALLEVTQLGLPESSTDAMKGTDWWIRELQQLRKSAAKSDPLEADMYMRVYRSSILTFIMGTQNFAEYNIEAAIKFNKVWAETDPENAWAQYQLAKLLDKAGEQQEAMKYRERAKALEKGKM